MNRRTARLADVQAAATGAFIPPTATAGRAPSAPDPSHRTTPAVRAAIIAAVAALCTAAPTGAAATPPLTWTTVQHNTTPPVVYFPDDICGPRASYETWVNTVEVNHLTALDDGSFHFVDFETGYVYVDYVDPATPDVRQSRTETFNVNLTPGGVYTQNSTFRLRDGNNLTIRARYTLVLVDDTPKVERDVLVVGGCPD